MTHRVALYARYSSDQQNPRSIADQFALVERHAAARGWTVTARFEDAAISGSAMANRPGLLALLAAAEAGAFDRVLVEHEDRLSRSLAHLADIAGRLKYARVTLSTLATDQVSTLHVAFNGAMAEEYLVNLSQKTRRGMASNAEKGLATGSRLYGYRTAPGGETVIVPDEANAVRRIFTLYAGGMTGREIAATLNAEGLPAPRGGPWNANQICGSRQRGNGVLHTELYIGQKVWNRMDVRKNPATGRRLPTMRPPAEWKRTPVPHLRIIDQPLWDRVQTRRDGAPGATVPPRVMQRRAGLLSGLLRCGACGASYTTYTRGRLICAAHREKGPAICGNARTLSRREVETRVLDGLRTRLLSPEVVRLYIRAYHDAWTELAATRRDEVAPLRTRLAALERRIARVVDAICEDGASPALRARLAALEAEQSEAAARLAEAEAAQAAAGGGSPAPVTLHPRLADLYARRVADLQARLTAPDLTDPAERQLVESVRDLIDRIVITPTGPQKAAPVDIVLHGRLALLLDQGPPQKGRARISQAARCGGLVVAGARYSPVPTSLPDIIPIAC